MTSVIMEDLYRGAVAEKPRNLRQSQIVKVLRYQGKELGPSKRKGWVFSKDLK